MRAQIAILLVSGLASAASAHVVTYGVDSSRTVTTLFGGDRRLDRMGFLGGATNTFTGGDFLRWDNGALTNNIGTHGWNTPILSDFENNNQYDANPDRADNASPFADEANKKAKLSEVFGPFSTGYKNMSWIIDGEDDKGYTLDLLFPKGQFLVPDDDDKTVEVTILERNGNSDFRVQGIKADGSIGESQLITRDKTEAAGWDLDSLEIKGPQKVSGVGLSLGDEWTGIVGIRILVVGATDNGPDIIGIGTTNPVPAPGALVLSGLAGMIVSRRRRS